MPPPCAGGGIPFSWRFLVDNETRITALQRELRMSSSVERRAHILFLLAQLGVMQRTDAPPKETR